MPSRRDLLRQLFWGLGAASLPAWCSACGRGSPGGSPAGSTLESSNSRFARIGALGAPDTNGLRLPAGFSARVVAVSGELPVAGARAAWHRYPDGAAVFPRAGGGWIYTSNSETDTGAGAGSLVFDAQGQLVDSYRVLSGTRRSCSGGATPWHSWLSGEEVRDGRVWECDPYGLSPAAARPALGCFAHEAVAVDAAAHTLYLTEDERDGRFYRFVAAPEDWINGARGQLQTGSLQAMRVHGDAEAAAQGPVPVSWVAVAQPDRPQVDHRLATTTAFAGGEGVWVHDRWVYFATKHDNRIWVHDSAAQTLEIVYDFGTASGADRILRGVDNLTVTTAGEILVAEDGGDMQLCVILPDRRVVALLQVVGQDASEITGPAFAPDGRTLYFSSQRGARNGMGSGITYAVSMPFAV